MAGCSKCSGCSPEPSSKPIKKAEKLEKGERSGNPRYPLVLVGRQAIYSDKDSQMIVTVLSDDSDDTCDCFTLKPHRILKDSRKERVLGESFDVSKDIGENCWKLQALL